MAGVSKDRAQNKFLRERYSMRTRLQNKLDDMFMSYVEQRILVGADIAVIHDGEQIYRRSWGWKDRKTRCG